MKLYRTQAGIALVTVLIMLVIITLLSISAMRVSTMELNMARNQESITVAFNGAQALSDAIIATPASTTVSGDVGYTSCTPLESGCNDNNIDLPMPYLATGIGDGVLRAQVRRLGPALRPPPRSISSSADKFMAAAFEITATYDNTQQNQGRYDLSEGVIVLVPTN